MICGRGGMRLFWMLVRLFRRRRPSARQTRRYLSGTVPFQRRPPQTETVLRGQCWIIDGDTIIIDKQRIRLAGIDAPELDNSWGQRSKRALVQMCKGQTITAQILPELSCDRLVAVCYLPDGSDLAAEPVRCGLALDWPKFSGGKYRHLEPIDARRKLWRAAERQRDGFLPPRF